MNNFSSSNSATAFKKGLQKKKRKNYELFWQILAMKIDHRFKPAPTFLRAADI
jgi:hypothetical protein